MWSSTDQQELDQSLLTLSDQQYQKFHTRLGVGRVLGVRIPDLERMAKQLIKRQRALDYLDGYTSCHYEGDVIYGMLVGYVSMDEEQRKSYILRFCRIIDNWATCDYALARWKFIQKKPEAYLTLIDDLLAGQNEWFSRVAYVLLLTYYLNDSYCQAVISRLNQRILPDYYSQMAAAWLISMGLVKYPEMFEAWIQSASLSPFVYQKALQKAIESRQITAEKKKIYQKMKNQLSVE